MLVRIGAAVLLLVTGCGSSFTAAETDAAVGTGGSGAQSGTGGTSGTGAKPGTGAAGGLGGMDGGPKGGSGGATSPPPCHPAGLVDTFDGAALSGLWTPQGASQDISVSGTLHFTPNPTTPEWSGVVSAAYDFDECAVWVRVPVLYSNATSGFTYFQLVGASATLSFEARDGNLTMKSGSDEGSTSYDPVAHQWWRIREAGPTVYFETSPDGIAWKEQQKVPSPADIKAMQVGLGLVPEAATSGPLETQFDDLDVIP